MINKKIKTIYRVGDLVKIISGDYKGEIGKIFFFNKKSLLISVKPINENINLKKINKKNKIESFIFLHASNLMLFEIDTNQKSRIGFKIINNEKLRYFKKSGNLINKLKKEK